MPGLLEVGAHHLLCIGFCILARLAEQYLALLEAATADPERRLSALPVLPVGQPDDAESILQTLDQLSDEEAERLLAAELRNHTP